MIDFTGQVAIVTGAGHGLGRLCALDLARRGAYVVVNDVSVAEHGSADTGSAADFVVAEIEDAGGVAHASHDRVTCPEGAESLVQAAVDRFGRLDAVISNARAYNSAPFEELSAVDWRHMLSSHLDSAFYLSQPAYPVMKASGYGRFVFISSSAGMFGQPLAAHFAAAKAGIVGLSNVIAIEGAGHGIRSNTVLPFGFPPAVRETVGPLKVFRREFAVPIVAFLASRACELTHHNYSACGGRFGRVFVGLSDGWLGDTDEDPTAEDIAAHRTELSAIEPFTVPMTVFEEVFGVRGRLGVST
jgi:NAD(P)-dependent dehydrogenase (short-subunit alcohol dehydrogenase family)